MNKKIISLLLIATTVTHGMKRPNIVQNDNAVNTEMVLFNTDLLSHIAIKSHNYQPCGIRTVIRALSNINRFFHDYYAQDTFKKELIDLCVLHNNSNHKNIARDLGCYAIYDKIERFTEIARDKKKKFNEDDFSDPWYLNITTTYITDNIFQQPFNHSLVYTALNYWNLETALTILNHAQELHFKYNKDENPLLKVAEIHGWYEENDIYLREEACNQLLTITQKLLEKGCRQ